MTGSRGGCHNVLRHTRVGDRAKAVPCRSPRVIDGNVCDDQFGGDFCHPRWLSAVTTTVAVIRSTGRGTGTATIFLPRGLTATSCCASCIGYDVNVIAGGLLRVSHSNGRGEARRVRSKTVRPKADKLCRSTAKLGCCGSSRFCGGHAATHSGEQTERAGAVRRGVSQQNRSQAEGLGPVLRRTAATHCDEATTECWSCPARGRPCKPRY